MAAQDAAKTQLKTKVNLTLARQAIGVDTSTLPPRTARPRQKKDKAQVSLEPSLDTFTAAYESGRPQVVWTRLIDDLETPVSAYLKIGHGRPYAFLFESVEGGARRGR